MTRWLVRVGALLALLVGSVPLLSAPSYAVEPTGGCWVWFAGTPQSDISSKLAPWADEEAAPAGPADHRISLSPAAPPAGSKGTITYSYNKGPENAGPAAQVKGTFRFSVNGGAAITSVVDFGTVNTGQTIPGRTLSVPFTVVAGKNEVVFLGVTFDAAPFSVRIDCNGQMTGTKAKNPRTDPAPTNVKASVTSNGTATPTTPTPETPDTGIELCLPDLPLPLPNPLPCAVEPTEPGTGPADGGGGDGGGDDGSGDGSGGGDGGGDGSGDGDGGSGGAGGAGGSVPGSPASGTVDYDCVLLPFNSDFDYKPATSVGGARPSAGAPVGLQARFGDLPGIAPVPINGPMQVTANLTVGGVDTKITGTSTVNVPAKTGVPVPTLTGSVAAAEDTLPVVMKDFSFYFPSFDITGNCKPAGGQDLGDLTVGSGTAGGSGSGAGTTDGTLTPGEAPESADPGTVTPGDSTNGPALSTTDQNLAVVDVRLEGSPTIGELFGATARRTLVVVVQNVGTATVDEPAVAMAMGHGSGLRPEPMDLAVGPLAPQQMQRIAIPMEMPKAGIGNYDIAGQVGTSSSGAFATTSQTYPWGLFLLNVVALGIAVWGLRRRLRVRRTPPPVVARESGRHTADGEAEATVDLAVLDGLFSRPRGGQPGLA